MFYAMMKILVITDISDISIHQKLIKTYKNVEKKTS